MMTDMSVPVKVEVCNTLGEMTGVSESLLLQSLSKKVSATTVAEVESNSSVVEGEVDAAALEERNLLSWSAGAFVVALEDEFWEVGYHHHTRCTGYNVLESTKISALYLRI